MAQLGQKQILARSKVDGRSDEDRSDDYLGFVEVVFTYIRRGHHLNILILFECMGYLSRAVVAQYIGLLASACALHLPTNLSK